MEQLRDLIEGESRLTCVSISDPYTIKQLVVDMSKDLLQKRKKQFKVRPYILLVSILLISSDLLNIENIILAFIKL